MTVYTATKPLFSYRIVPTSVCLFVGRYSNISRYEMELLPTPPVPKIKMKPAVTIQLRDIKTPIKDTN